MLNTVVLNYTIIRLIGKGGMASVYEARHNKLGTKVAIKVLDPSLSANANIRQRFENEARTMAGLNHPNIARVIDFDESAVSLSIIMEYLEGEDLGALIKKRGALPADEIRKYISQVLQAIAYAHQQGVVHRDIKPANIFIEPGGQVKVLDFGIAKILDAGSGELTQTGTMLGTPVYMSPEQVQGEKELRASTDIYSLGVTLYYLTRGQAPYDSSVSSLFNIQTKIVNEPLPGLHPANLFDDVIKTATQKSPENRFRDCLAMLHALEDLHEKNAIDPESTIVQHTGSDSTIIQAPVTGQMRQQTPLSVTTVSKNSNNAIVYFLIVVIIVAAGVFYMMQQKNKQVKSSYKDNTANTNQTANDRPGDTYTKQSDSLSGNTNSVDVLHYEELFSSFHQTLTEQGHLNEAMGYYAEYVNFNGQYKSRDEIREMFEQTLIKYTPSGTRVLSFQRRGSEGKVFDYQIDYSLLVNNSDPEQYKRFLIDGVVEYDNNDQIVRIQDLSTKRIE